MESKIRTGIDLDPAPQKVKDIAQHVTRAFVRQYRYLGFHATWIKEPPPNFSFSSRESVFSLRELLDVLSGLDAFRGVRIKTDNLFKCQKSFVLILKLQIHTPQFIIGTRKTGSQTDHF